MARFVPSRMAAPFVAGALAVGLSVAGASLAVAQSSSGAPPKGSSATPPAAAAASISDKELRTFADAALEVKKINDSYRPRFRAAETPAAKQQVQKEATEKMTEAVQSKGLSVDKYNQIVRVAQADPQVAKTIDQFARGSD
jgi:hypothetical protein